MDTDNLLRLLIAHPSSHEAEGLLNVLRKAGYATRPTYLSRADDVSPTLEKGGLDLVLCAQALEDAGLPELMALFTAAQKDLPVIVVSEDDAEEAVVDALRLGARDCVRRDRPRHILEAVRRELKALELRREQRLCESSLREHQRRSNALLAASREALAYVLDGMHIHANDHYARVFGLSEGSELAQVPVMDLVDQADRPRFREILRAHGRGGGQDEAVELTALRGGDTPFPALFTVTASIFEGEACLQVVVASLEPAATPEQSVPAAQTAGTGAAGHGLDVLLGLVEERLATAIRAQQGAFLLLGELDSFHELRQGVGALGVHELMSKVMDALAAEIGDDAVLTRCGDALFAVLADDPDLRAAAMLAERVRATVAGLTLCYDDRLRELTCSIGMTAITELTPGGHRAIRWAEAACRRAAAAGGNRFRAHERVDPATEEARSRALDKGIRELLQGKRDVLRFRPIVSLHGTRREFYEVIPRVPDDEGRPFATDEVYRAFDAAGLSRELDQWMLERVVELTRDMTAQGRDIQLILGLSDHAMDDENRVLSVAKALRAAGLDGRRLIFRLSETAASIDLKPARRFAAGLHELRCRLMLTHFGSGLTPFRVLEHVDADYLAFDTAFVQDIARNPESREAVAAICAEARERSKRTLAPGVQDADTLAVLWRCGVDYASGDYLQEAGPEMSYDFQAEV